MASSSEEAPMKVGSHDKSNKQLLTETYSNQTKTWPRDGQHILAQYDDTSIIVYQAFNPQIAKYAVQNQSFGGPHYSFDRMSWIKTNFMWMMYRCGWAQKANQERVLAIRITRQGFEDILSKAYTAQRQKREGLNTANVEVRLQWDPDHDPKGGKLQRRAIQLGLKGKILQAFGSDYIVDVTDVTDFVHEQYAVLQNKGIGGIVSPLEKIFIPSNDQTCRNIDLDFFSQPKVVAFTS